MRGPRQSPNMWSGARDVSSAASPGEPRWRRPCSPGARPMGSARATLRSPGDRGRPVAADTAGVRPDERPGVGIHDDVRPRQQHPVRARTTAKSDERHLHGRFQRRQGARSQDRIDAHRRSDGARAVLGRQCQRPLESGSEPDGACQPPVDVRRQPAARGPEHRDGRHRVHDLERQAILRRRSERSDLAAGDLDPAGGHGRQSGHGCRSGLAAAHHHTVAPGIPCRASQPEWRGLRPSSSANSDDDRRLR